MKKKYLAALMATVMTASTILGTGTALAAEDKADTKVITD